MSNGLEDVVAAETVLSDVDGLAGRLIIRGQPLEALAGRSNYEAVLSLLWDGFFPDLPTDLRQPLADARVRVFELLGADLHLVADRPAFDADACAHGAVARWHRTRQRAAAGCRPRRAAPRPAAPPGWRGSSGAGRQPFTRNRHVTDGERCRACWQSWRRPLIPTS
jgi:citrate synthase